MYSNTLWRHSNIFKYTLNTLKYIQVHSNTFKYIQIHPNTLKDIINTLKYSINVIQVHSNTFKYTITTFKYIHILSNTFKYTINTQYKHLNKFIYIQIPSNTLKYIEMYYKCIVLHWNILPIQWSTL
jgi:hypothetical protein